MDIDEAWVKSIIKAQDGVEDILDITFKPAIGENENYGSTLFRIILKLQMNKQIHLKNVILKVKSQKLTSYSEKEEELIFDTENRVIFTCYCYLEVTIIIRTNNIFMYTHLFINIYIFILLKRSINIERFNRIFENLK